MSIYLSFFYLRKPAGSPPHPVACLPVVGFSPNNELAIGLFFENMFSEVDIKSLMTASNLTLGEVIWLLFFELVLRILRTRTDKIAITYIEVALYKTPF